MPRGYSDRRSLTRLEVLVPAVMIRSPLRTSLAFGTSSNRRSPGAPTAGPTLPGSPLSSAWAETPNSGSVSSITTALPSETDLTLPTRPAPLITGWSTATPSLEPLLIWNVWYQELGERAITRAWTGL